MKNVLILVFLLAGTMLSAQCQSGDCTNGKGVFYYSSGSKYSGDFKDGKRHGKGKFVWNSGAKYDGEWRNGKREGQGQEILADGTKYMGSYSNDQKHGAGALYDSDNNLIKKGTWSNSSFIENNTTPPNPESSKPPVPLVQPVKSGTKAKFLNMGIGLGSHYTLDGYGLKGGTASGIPPVSLSLDVVSKNNKNLTFGGYLGYTSNKYTIRSEYYGTYGYRFSYIILGFRSTYSFDLFDSKTTYPYLAGMLGYTVARAGYFGDDAFSASFGNLSASSALTYSGSIGLRHMFNPKMGGFIEAGYGIAFITAGVSLQLQ